MIHPEAFAEQAILRFDHVAISVAGKFRVHSIARFARFAVTDVIRQDDEKLRHIERLARAEKFPGEFRPNKLRATAGGVLRAMTPGAVGAQQRIHRTFERFQ